MPLLSLLLMKKIVVRHEGLMIQTDVDAFMRMAVFGRQKFFFFLNVAMHVAYINAIRLQLPLRFKL